VPDLFTPDGFVQAQLLVHALEKGDYNVDKMISSLEGYKFLAPKGIQAIRPQDHAMLQPMFRVKLTKAASGRLVGIVTGTATTFDTAPPVVPMRG
jgi:branched-chain amino acid transport system substrate-binding protein